MEQGDEPNWFGQSSLLFFELLVVVELFESSVLVEVVELDPEVVGVEAVFQLVGGWFIASDMHCWSRSLISCPRSDQFRSRTFEVLPEESWQLQPEPRDTDEAATGTPLDAGVGDGVVLPGAEMVVSGGVVNGGAGLACAGLGCCW
jgi:hypothetical protein